MEYALLLLASNEGDIVCEFFDYICLQYFGWGWP